MAEPIPRLREKPKRPSYQPLVPLAAALCAGVALDRFAPLPISAWWALAGAGLAGWLALWLSRLDRTAMAALLAAAATTGAAWHHACWNLFPNTDVGFFASRDSMPVCLKAVACEAGRWVPAQKRNPLKLLTPGERTRLFVSVLAIRDGTEWRPASGEVEMMIDGAVNNIRTGDRLQVFGELAAPKPPMNPGEFDFAAYLRANRQLCTLYVKHPEGIQVEEAGPWSFGRLVDTARHYGYRRYWEGLDPDRAGLGAAVMLGAREQLDADVSEAYLETGTVHLLVISGAHVGLLASVLWWLMRRVTNSKTVIVAVVGSGVVFYALVTGMQPPVTRAVVLVLCTCLALASGRPQTAFNAMAAGVIVVLAMNPTNLFNVGAQLSFLAVAVLAWFGQRLMREPAEGDPLTAAIRHAEPWWLRGLRRVGRMVWLAFLLSAAVWAVVLPLVLARFHLAAFICPFVSVLLWPIVALSTISGFAVLALGWIPGLGPFCEWTCDLTLWLMNETVDLGRRTPGSHAWLPGPSDWWLIGFYAGLGFLVAFPQWRPRPRWCWAALGVWISVSWLAGWASRPVNSLECAILSVEHGFAAVVHMPDGGTILYDAGELNAPDSAMRSISGYLWHRGIKRLDAVVLSHSDVDHFNALPGLLDRFSVGRVYVSPMMFQQPGVALSVLENALAQHRVRIDTLAAGERLLDRSGCTIDVLHPPSEALPGGSNPNSIVLSLHYRDSRILLPGDLESPGLEVLLANGAPPCDLLLAPHHGSRRGQSPKLAQECRPQWVVISGSRKKDFREIEALHEQLGVQVLHTSTAGMVTARVDDDGLQVVGFRKAPKPSWETP